MHAWCGYLCAASTSGLHARPPAYSLPCPCMHGFLALHACRSLSAGMQCQSKRGLNSKIGVSMGRESSTRKLLCIWVAAGAARAMS